MTNQASKDELTKAIYEAMQTPYLSERHDAINAIIRTEKLKLLAEVREQQIPVMALKAKKPHDAVQIQAVPIESLTKLEALYGKDEN